MPSYIGFEFWVVLDGPEFVLMSKFGYSMTLCLLLLLFSSVEGEVELCMSKSNFSKAASFGSYSKQHLIKKWIQ